ncbi:MAG: FKBP-type peptidyl-prolyl cis-trans isomerase [Bacteroidales bacterium]|nr:FKBP-type peptidyl-prolyl cis-trans isomerase [Bacteroidales bacterium]MBD5284602.1 FKBP-type peptidyl-prolyl cis-trans isomerase [Bacteroides sp.]
MDKLSYAWGLAMGSQLKAMGVKELNSESFKDGVKVAFDGGTPEISTEEAQKLINDYLQELEAKATAAAKEAGNKFLEENAKKEGVKVTSTGLQYRVIKEGTGAQPTATDEVTVHYTGKLLDGTVFDSSVNRGEPATFPLNRVIPGWTEGVQLMKEGAKYEFYIPSDLAYGPNGVPNAIPPHATLIFEVELISIGKKESKLVGI